jgi:hypothetical protein
MLGDTILIHGTGFSTVAAENTVRLAQCRAVCSTSDFKPTVVSASATTLRVALPWTPGGAPGAGTFKVKVKTDSAVAASEAIFRWPATIQWIENKDYGSAGWMRADDQIHMLVFGLGAAATQPTLSVNGKAVAGITMQKNGAAGLESSVLLKFTTPKDIYPATDPATDLTDTATVTVTMTAQGNTVSRRFAAFRFPRSSVFTATYAKSYTTIQDSASPASAKEITVTGKNMVGPVELVYTVAGAPQLTIVKSTDCGLGQLCDAATGGVPTTSTGQWNVFARYARFSTSVAFPAGTIYIVP